MNTTIIVKNQNLFYRIFIRLFGVRKIKKIYNEIEIINFNKI